MPTKTSPLVPVNPVVFKKEVVDETNTVVFLRHRKEFPTHVSEPDRKAFKRNVEKVSAALDDPRFTKGSRTFTFPSSFSRQAIKTLRLWCEADGWPVEIKKGQSGRHFFIVSHP